jgi:hypothetical protein
MTLQIDDDTQRELIMAAARAAGFLSGLLAIEAISSETQRTAAQRMAEDIQAAVTAAIKAQKVAA